MPAELAGGVGEHVELIVVGMAVVGGELQQLGLEVSQSGRPLGKPDLAGLHEDDGVGGPDVLVGLVALLFGLAGDPGEQHVRNGNEKNVSTPGRCD